MNLTKNPLFYLSLVLTIIVGVQAWGVAQAAFQEPTSVFPTSDVSAPLDTGDSSQKKYGDLDFVTGPGVTDVVSSIGIGGVCLKANDIATVVTCKWLWNQILGAWGVSGSDVYYTAGKVGIGITVPGAGLDVKKDTIKFQMANGRAHTWFPYTNGEVYITGYTPGTGNGDIHFRIDDGTAYTTRMIIEGTTGNVGIGTTPSTGVKLEIAGQIKITGGGAAAGRVLTSNASGLASWETPPSSLPSGTDGQVLRSDGTNWYATDGLKITGNGVFVGNTNGNGRLITTGEGGFALFADSDDNADDTSTAFIVLSNDYWWSGDQRTSFVVRQNGDVRVMRDLRVDNNTAVVGNLRIGKPGTAASPFEIWTGTYTPGYCSGTYTEQICYFPGGVRTCFDESISCAGFNESECDARASCPWTDPVDNVVKSLEVDDVGDVDIAGDVDITGDLTVTNLNIGGDDGTTIRLVGGNCPTSGTILRRFEAKTCQVSNCNDCTTSIAWTRNAPTCSYSKTFLGLCVNERTETCRADTVARSLCID